VEERGENLGGGRRGRESKCTDECTSLKEESQLADRHLERFLCVSTPKRLKSSALESLLAESQARAVPQQHLHARAAAFRKQEHIPGERLGLQLRDDQGVQAIVLLAYFHGSRVRKDTNASREPNHASRRRRCAPYSTARPPMRTPLGAISVSPTGDSGSGSTSTRRRTGS